MADLINHVLMNLPEYLCKSWLLLIGIVALFSGFVCIGAGIAALLGARLFGTEGSYKW